MRKVTFIMLALTIMGGIIFAGCKKNKEEVQPTPTVTNNITVSYFILNSTEAGYSDCFKFDVSYTNSDGTMIEEKAVSELDKTITTKAPFTAKLEGKVVYNEAELPAKNIKLPGGAGGISYISDAGNGSSHSDVTLYEFDNVEEFKNVIAEHPELLRFSEILEIK